MEESIHTECEVTEPHHECMIIYEVQLTKATWEREKGEIGLNTSNSSHAVHLTMFGERQSTYDNESNGLDR